MAIDMSTTYLGLELPHPFVAGASPLSDDIDAARALEHGGAAMIVLRSLFEEQIDRDAMAHHEAAHEHAEAHAEARSYMPQPSGFVFGPDDYLRHLAQVRRRVGVPVAASLNAHSKGGWIDYARRIEEAGADALELNLFDVITDPTREGGDVEHELVEIVAGVCDAVHVPVAVKLSPFHSSLPNLAKRLHTAGARGLVLFNRFYEPDLDVDELEVRSEMQLSSPAELGLRLRWLAILSGQLGDVDLAVTGGVHDVDGAVKAIMCGAHAVQLVAVLLRNGPERIGLLRDRLAAWLDEHDYTSLRQMRGSMDTSRAPDAAAYARGNYIRVLQTYRPDTAGPGAIRQPSNDTSTSRETR